MIKKDLNYEFAASGGGEEVGFNEPVVTGFKGHIAYFLARESIQNIIDAAIKFPAQAEFQLLKIKANELPKPEQLKEVFSACRDYFRNNQQSVSFFQNANDVINQNKQISILKVSDFNTKGLTGDDDDIDGNYYNLLKSSGACSKQRGSGGSFGLGKGAYFAASSFHTIFVSSIYEKDKCVFQGKLRLVTHRKNGLKFQPTGSFGLAEQRPVRDYDAIPRMFRRRDQGTDVFIVGFYDENEWEKQIIRSVLNNFWLAVLRGMLEISVASLKISRDNIGKLMFKYFSEDERDNEENPNPLPAFLTYTDDKNHINFEKTLQTLGRVNLYILLKENYYRKISYFRKTGMEIQKRSHHIPVGYAGIFVCDNDEGNEILRMMENPQHNRWDPHNAREKTEKAFSKAKKADKELKEFIRESLKSLFEMKGSESLNVPGLEKYLYLTEEDEERFSGTSNLGEFTSGTSDKEAGSEVGVEDEESGIEIIKPIRVIKGTKNVVADGKIKLVGRGGKSGFSDQEPRGGSEEEGINGGILTDIETRSFAVQKKDKDTEHVIIIKGKPGLKFNLAISVGTDDSFEELEIIRALDFFDKPLKKKGNKIYDLLMNENSEIKLRISFGTDERYSLRITAYEN